MLDHLGNSPCLLFVNTPRPFMRPFRQPFPAFPVFSPGRGNPRYNTLKGATCRSRTPSPGKQPDKFIPVLQNFPKRSFATDLHPFSKNEAPAFFWGLFRRFPIAPWRGDPYLSTFRGLQASHIRAPATGCTTGCRSNKVPWINLRGLLLPGMPWLSPGPH